MFDMRIQSEDDIAQYFQAPVLGIIPDFDRKSAKHRKGYGGYAFAGSEKGEYEVHQLIRNADSLVPKQQETSEIDVKYRF